MRDGVTSEGSEGLKLVKGRNLLIGCDWEVGMYGQEVKVGMVKG